ncbi:MAG: hypothetical protein J0H89_15835, partial [Rhizobiales bacterium]|nr:hypothetical protein [Hyphomicrobiales bacterium]
MPPEEQYDFAKAQQKIWERHKQKFVPDAPPYVLSAQERADLSFPALSWLDAAFARMSSSSMKILAFTPVHVANQGWPGTRTAAVEAECKARVVAVARRRGATVIDWRIASPITRNDANYWDESHYRVPIARRLADEMA